MKIWNQNDRGTTSLRRLGVLLLVATLLANFALASEPPTAGPGPRIPVLILTGQSNTDWRWTSTHLRGLLEESGKFEVEISTVPEGTLADTFYLQRFKLFVIDYAGIPWGDLAEKNFLQAVKNGTGVVAIADSVAAFESWKEYEELIGFRCAADAYLQNFQPVEVTFTDGEHPIAKGYGGLGDRSDQLAVGLELAGADDHQVIATVAPVGGGPAQPALVVGSYGQGRTFATPLGHVAPGRQDTWGVQSAPASEQLFLRACEWAATGEVTGLRRLAPNTLTEADRAAGWQLLFDGNTPHGWADMGGGGFPQDRWNADDGALLVLPAADSNGLATVEQFDQFELALEWKVEGGGPGSLGLAGRGDASSGSQFALGGAHADYGTDPSSAMHLLRPPGEFNHARVVATYGQVEHWLNGVKIKTFYDDPAQWAQRVTGDRPVSDVELNELPLSRICLENESAAVWYRNIKIRHLPLPVAPVDLANPTATPEEQVVVELFNGRDLEGWNWVPQTVSGDPYSNRDRRDAWSVDPSGLLIGAGLPQGQLRSVEGYQDFELELDWRFNPVNRAAGEGAILLRTTGGDTRFPSAVEVRLTHRQVGALFRQGDFDLVTDGGRSNGRLTRAIRDMENNRGDWNHLELRFSGGDLVVRVNGEVVNAASQATIQPGVISVTTRVEMQFRNVTLKPL